MDVLFSDVKPDDVLLVVHSIFDPNFDRLVKLPIRKICYFHGITSPQLLDAAASELADLCRSGLEQVEQFGLFDMVITNSDHTLAALPQNGGIKRLRVIPPVFSDMPAFQQQTGPVRRSPAASVRILSVGRVVPHKRIEDAITLLQGTRERGVDAHLTVVGGLPNYEYFRTLVQYARQQGVLNKVEFSGVLADCDLFRIYQSSDILVTTSMHEGFCVPVLEAQHFGCGVLVRKGTAAEYLAEPDEIFEMANGIYSESFFKSLQAMMQQRRSNSLIKGMARETTVLEKSSDKVWAKILCNGDLPRQT
jgi:glycosyltransferase involved in cell wall biosynthesis